MRRRQPRLLPFEAGYPDKEAADTIANMLGPIVNHLAGHAWQALLSLRMRQESRRV